MTAAHPDAGRQPVFDPPPPEEVTAWGQIASRVLSRPGWPT